MKTIEIDKTAEGFSVTVCRGIQAPKVKTFTTHNEAESFALAKLGMGCLIDSSQMTDEQRTAHDARKARLAAL